MALGNGRRARLGATVVLTAVFALGIAAGAGLNREEQATAPDPETRVSTEPTGRTEPPNEWIIDRMNLSMDQRAQVDSVVQHYGSRMSELQKAYRPQYRAIVDSTDGALRSLLGGEQLLRYDSLSAAAARWRARNRSGSRRR